MAALPPSLAVQLPHGYSHSNFDPQSTVANLNFPSHHAQPCPPNTYSPPKQQQEIPKILQAAPAMAWSHTYGPPRPPSTKQEPQMSPTHQISVPRYTTPPTDDVQGYRPPPQADLQLVSTQNLPVQLKIPERPFAARPSSYQPPRTESRFPPSLQIRQPLARKSVSVITPSPEVPTRRSASVESLIAGRMPPLQTYMQHQPENSQSSTPWMRESPVARPSGPRNLSESTIPSTQIIQTLAAQEETVSPASNVTKKPSTLSLPEQSRPRSTSDASDSFGIRANPWAEETPKTPGKAPEWAYTSEGVEEQFLERTAHLSPGSGPDSDYSPEPQTAVYERNLALLDMYLEAPDSEHIATLIRRQTKRNNERKQSLPQVATTSPDAPPLPQVTPAVPEDNSLLDHKSLASIRSLLSSSPAPPALARSSSVLPTYFKPEAKSQNHSEERDISHTKISSTTISQNAPSTSTSTSTSSSILSGPPSSDMRVSPAYTYSAPSSATLQTPASAYARSFKSPPQTSNSISYNTRSMPPTPDYSGDGYLSPGEYVPLEQRYAWEAMARAGSSEPLVDVKGRPVSLSPLPLNPVSPTRSSSLPSPPPPPMPEGLRLFRGPPKEDLNARPLLVRRPAPSPNANANRAAGVAQGNTRIRSGPKPVPPKPHLTVDTTLGKPLPRRPMMVPVPLRNEALMENIDSRVGRASLPSMSHGQGNLLVAGGMQMGSETRIQRRSFMHGTGEGKW